MKHEDLIGVRYFVQGDGAAEPARIH